MKKIEAVIRPAKVSEVCKELNKIGYLGIMVSEVEGHGAQGAGAQEFRLKTCRVERMTKASLQLVVKEEDVDKIIKVIAGSASTGKAGDGKIFVYPVEEAVRI